MASGSCGVVEYADLENAVAWQQREHPPRPGPNVMGPVHLSMEFLEANAEASDSRRSNDPACELGGFGA